MILVDRSASRAGKARSDAEMEAELDQALQAWGRLSTASRLAMLRAALLSDADGGSGPADAGESQDAGEPGRPPH